jgi:hypothetical protein
MIASTMYSVSISWKFFQHQTMISSSSVHYEHHQSHAFTSRDVFRISSKLYKTFFVFSSFLFILFSSSSHSLISHHLAMIVFSSLLNWSRFFFIFAEAFIRNLSRFCRSLLSLLSAKSSFRDFAEIYHVIDEFSLARFMNVDITNQIKEICYQLRDFLRINHRFDDFVFVNIKSFVIDIVKKDSSITSKSARKTRSSKFLSNISWSQVWVIDREEFKKAIVNFEKIVELSFSFSKSHSKESFKEFINFAIELFVSSKLIL